MPDKINVWPIVRDHVKTLHVARESRLSRADLSLFFGLPFVAAAILASFKIRMPDKYADFALVFHSIVIPLIVNVLFLIYSIKERRDDNERPADAVQARLRQKSQALLEEVYKNLSYTVLVSVVTVLALGLTKLIGTPPLPGIPRSVFTFFNPAAIWVVYFSVYFLMMHLGLTALMIVKRTHALLTSEFVED